MKKKVELLIAINGFPGFNKKNYYIEPFSNGDCRVIHFANMKNIPVQSTQLTAIFISAHAVIPCFISSKVSKLNVEKVLSPPHLARAEQQLPRFHFLIARVRR